jgi:hypothetical protein
MGHLNEAVLLNLRVRFEDLVQGFNMGAKQARLGYLQKAGNVIHLDQLTNLLRGMAGLRIQEANVQKALDECGQKETRDDDQRERTEPGIRRAEVGKHEDDDSTEHGHEPPNPLARA